MSLYMENLLTGALPQTLLKWDPQNEEQLKPVPSVAGQKDIKDFLASDNRDASLLDTDWFEQQFDLSLFDSIGDVQHCDSGEDDDSLPVLTTTIDEQLSFIDSLPVDEVLPLLANPSPDANLEKVTQELMDSIVEQGFLSDSSSISGDSSFLPTSPGSSGWNDSFPPLSPDGSIFSCPPSPDELFLNYVPSSPEEPLAIDTAMEPITIMEPITEPHVVVIQLSADPPSPSSYSSYSDDSNDPDFLPELSPRRRQTPYSRVDSDSKVVVPKVKSVSSRSKPNHTEKKQRKKLQNKNAATRYRVKKKSEAELIDKEYEELSCHNEELTNKVDQLTREIEYLKDLIHEVRIAKGVI